MRYHDHAQEEARPIDRTVLGFLRKFAEARRRRMAKDLVLLSLYGTEDEWYKNDHDRRIRGTHETFPTLEEWMGGKQLSVLAADGTLFDGQVYPDVATGSFRTTWVAYEVVMGDDGLYVASAVRH